MDERVTGSGSREPSDAGVSSDARVTVDVVDNDDLIGTGTLGLLPQLDKRLRSGRFATSVDDLLGDGPPNKVVLLDLRLENGTSPRENVARLVAVGARVILLTYETRPVPLREATGIGADALALKGDKGTSLAELILAVAGSDAGPGGRVTPLMASTVLSQERAIPMLSDQDRKIAALITAGRSTRQMARTLSISEKTVEYHVQKLLDRFRGEGLPAASRAELAKTITELGYLDGLDPT